MDANKNDKTANWWSSSLVYSARSDVGMKRRNNQDSYSAHPAPTTRVWRTRGHVFVVADGMGAHKAGELASKIAATEAPQFYLKRTNQSPSEALSGALLDAHEVIRKRSEGNFDFNNMGTTCDMLVLMPGVGYVGHVGDSRVYRLRNHVFEQLTFDHSLVWEVKYFPTSHSAYRQVENIPKNIITRSLGPTDNLTVDVEGPFETQAGDVFLMCSDGLSGRVEDSEMGQILELFSPADATEALVNLANLRGGPDNCTVVVAKILSNELPESQGSSKQERGYEKRPPLTIPAWILMSLTAIFGILAAVFLVFRFFPGGWTSLGVAVSSFVAFLCVASPTIFGQVPKQVERQGKGPYMRASSLPTQAFCDSLETTCQQLCAQMRNDPNVEPDWNGVDRARDMAVKAREKNDFAGSVRANICVVNYIMREVRKYVELVKRTRSHSVVHELYEKPGGNETS
ncbi:MAG: protein phosphatase 2C domain-containing protein [Thermoguttaceae bacterium]|nr:protein phosphatase 2C domain-containing protein [Thermoguttaceae bacterium]